MKCRIPCTQYSPNLKFTSSNLDSSSQFLRKRGWPLIFHGEWNWTLSNCWMHWKVKMNILASTSSIDSKDKNLHACWCCKVAQTTRIEIGSMEIIFTTNYEEWDFVYAEEKKTMNKKEQEPWIKAFSIVCILK